MPPEFVTLPDSDAVAAEAAARFCALAEEAVSARGRFVVALAGGSTPEKLYQLLALRSVRWERCVVFFSDDRVVPEASPFSNAGLAKRLLPLNPVTTFAIPSETYPEAAGCARAYEATLVATLGPEPVFDLVLLGMGDDGHTASLFPGKDALGATGWITHSTPGVLPPPVDRVTFTFPTINAARNVLFLVTGANKAQKVALWKAAEGTRETLPVLGVEPTHGTLTVLLDAGAAGA